MTPAQKYDAEQDEPPRMLTFTELRDEALRREEKGEPYIDLCSQFA